MFDLTFGKLAIIFTLCLIILGPEKLPKLAQQLGRWTGQARAMARHFRAQLEQEIAAEELLKQKRDLEQRLTEPLKSTQEALHSVTNEIGGMSDAMNDTVNRVVQDATSVGQSSSTPTATSAEVSPSADAPVVDPDTAHRDTDVGNPANYIASDQAYITAHAEAQAHIVQAETQAQSTVQEEPIVDLPAALPPQTESTTADQKPPAQ